MVNRLRIQIVNLTCTQSRIRLGPMWANMYENQPHKNYRGITYNSSHGLIN